MTNETNKIALPHCNIPDLEKLVDANPDMANMVPGVGYCAYDPASQTAWICFDDTKQWTIIRPIDRDDFLARIANFEMMNRADSKPEKLN
jgi:hypothetical protein